MPDLNSLVSSIQNNAQRAGQADVFEQKIMPDFVKVVEKLLAYNQVNKNNFDKISNETLHVIRQFVKQMNNLEMTKPVVNVVPNTVPVVLETQPNIVIEAQGSYKWEFTIHRQQNGLMDSVTAERKE
jgi:hypothetical protein